MIVTMSLLTLIVGSLLIVFPKKGGITKPYLRRKGFKTLKSFETFKLKGLKSWILTIKIVKNFKMDQRDKEIYEAISYLRNLNTVGSAQDMSTDTVLEELSQLEGSMKKAYFKMLSLLRVNEKEKSAEVMYEYVGSEISRDFGRLLIKWDDIDPKELMEILVSHQKAIKEKRSTYQKRKDEIISDIIYLPIVLNIIFVLINFIYVAYFLEQQKMFNNYF